MFFFEASHVHNQCVRFKALQLRAGLQEAKRRHADTVVNGPKLPDAQGGGWLLASSGLARGLWVAMCHAQATIVPVRMCVIR